LGETIAAISTPPGEGGIGIVRMSGPKAWPIAAQIFRRAAGKNRFQNEEKFDFIPQPRKLYYGYIIDENKNRIDEVLLTYMPAPHTYTCEDIVEINAHGGFIPLKKILQLLIRKGARLAEAGEFTRRAYINGRIDLLQAESVLALIRAKTEKGLQAAIQSLRGYFSEEIKQIRAALLTILAEIEAEVDFPLDELGFDDFHYQRVKKRIENIKEKFDIYRKKIQHGKVLQEGLKVVIAGRPNVGKSSLYNYLIGEERAIVTEIPGTTRDLLIEYININGIPIKIIDTAGFRRNGDQVEKIGMGYSKKALEAADLILFMIDLSVGIIEEDRWIYHSLPPRDEKALFIVANKLDLVDKGIKQTRQEILKNFPDEHILEISLLEKKGLAELKDAISGVVFEGGFAGEEDAIILEVRLTELFEKAAFFLQEALASLEANFPLDVISIDLKQVFRYLGELLGEETGEEVLDYLFSRFCIGK
jgi:tRNA modification GTPase